MTVTKPEYSEAEKREINHCLSIANAIYLFGHDIMVGADPFVHPVFGTVYATCVSNPIPFVVPMTIINPFFQKE